MGVSTDFASRLRNLRETGGLSQGELAEQLKVSRGAISFYENGDRVPNIEFLDSVASYFNVSFDYLLGYHKNYKSSEERDLWFLSAEAVSNLMEADSFEELIDGLFTHQKLHSFLRLFSQLAEVEQARVETGKLDPPIVDFIQGTIDRDFIIFNLTKLLVEILDDVALKSAYQDFTVEDAKRSHERYLKTTHAYEEQMRLSEEKAEKLLAQYRKENSKRLDALSKIHGDVGDIKDSESDTATNTK